MQFQPHFDYACSSCFSLLKKILKLILQKIQNNCILFCLNLPRRPHIDPLLLRKVNWLPTSGRVTVLRISFLSTGVELHWDIFIKRLSLHSADIAQGHR